MFLLGSRLGKATENVRSVALREGVGIGDHYLVLKVFRLEVIRVFPKLRHLFLLTLADGTLIVVAESVLGPKWALSFQVDFVSAEKWRSLELIKDGCDLAIEALQFLDWCTRPKEVPRCDLGSTLGRLETSWEVDGEEI